MQHYYPTQFTGPYGIMFAFVELGVEGSYTEYELKRAGEKFVRDSFYGGIFNCATNQFSKHGTLMTKKLLQRFKENGQFKFKLTKKGKEMVTNKLHKIPQNWWKPEAESDPGFVHFNYKSFMSGGVVRAREDADDAFPKKRVKRAHNPKKKSQKQGFPELTNFIPTVPSKKVSERHVMDFLQGLGNQQMNPRLEFGITTAEERRRIHQILERNNYPVVGYSYAAHPGALANRDQRYFVISRLAPVPTNGDRREGYVRIFEHHKSKNQSKHWMEKANFSLKNAIQMLSTHVEVIRSTYEIQGRPGWGIGHGNAAKLLPRHGGNYHPCPRDVYPSAYSAVLVALYEMNRPLSGDILAYEADFRSETNCSRKEYFAKLENQKLIRKCKRNKKAGYDLTDAGRKVAKELIEHNHRMNSFPTPRPHRAEVYVSSQDGPVAYGQLSPGPPIPVGSGTAPPAGRRLQQRQPIHSPPPSHPQFDSTDGSDGTGGFDYDKLHRDWMRRPAEKKVESNFSLNFSYNRQGCDFKTLLGMALSQSTTTKRPAAPDGRHLAGEEADLRRVLERSKREVKRHVIDVEEDAALRKALEESRAPEKPRVEDDLRKALAASRQSQQDELRKVQERKAADLQAHVRSLIRRHDATIRILRGVIPRRDGSIPAALRGHQQDLEAQDVGVFADIVENFLALLDMDRQRALELCGEYCWLIPVSDYPQFYRGSCGGLAARRDEDVLKKVLEESRIEEFQKKEREEESQELKQAIQLSLETNPIPPMDPDFKNQLFDEMFRNFDVDSNIVLMIDTRERGGKIALRKSICEDLKDARVQFITTKLPQGLGDYVFALIFEKKKILIPLITERKSAVDFADSMRDKRLEKQLRAMMGLRNDIQSRLANSLFAKKFRDNLSINYLIEEKFEKYIVKSSHTDEIGRAGNPQLKSCQEQLRLLKSERGVRVTETASLHETVRRLGFHYERLKLQQEALFREFRALGPGQAAALDLDRVAERLAKLERPAVRCILDWRALEGAPGPVDNDCLETLKIKVKELGLYNATMDVAFLLSFLEANDNNVNVALSAIVEHSFRPK